jgi:hypothetical protein
LRILARNKANNIAIGEAGGISALKNLLSDADLKILEFASSLLSLLDAKFLFKDIVSAGVFLVTL